MRGVKSTFVQIHVFPIKVGQKFVKSLRCNPTELLLASLSNPEFVIVSKTVGTKRQLPSLVVIKFDSEST